ncbi:hypothetical protein NPIL_624461 [Nephila pilipes]|uniref:Uncharacterized protein n=1 Tax=Nephila pilipes TaxID=299642 RepID=A0A8X6TD76_NEPPI|nr:hypothetical protein NPIL_624461 [Nephila pilipes]
MTRDPSSAANKNIPLAAAGGDGQSMVGPKPKLHCLSKVNTSDSDSLTTVFETPHAQFTLNRLAASIFNLTVKRTE